MFPHTLFLTPLIHSRILLRRSSTPATQEELQKSREGGADFEAAGARTGVQWLPADSAAESRFLSGPHECQELFGFFLASG